MLISSLSNIQQLETGIDCELPDGFQYLLKPARYKIDYSGRGAAKSWSFARALILCAYKNPKERILCARELQNSIAESVHKLLSDQIEAMGISPWFVIQQKTIYSKAGAEFIFAGLRNDPDKIKSSEGITKCWVEEAHKVSERSWEILIPTIREPDSEIWVSFNPDEETDPTYQRFITNHPPEKMDGKDYCVVHKSHWTENPWFPEVLRQEKDYLWRVDPERAATVWDGEPRKTSSAYILRDKCIVESFTPPDPIDSTELWDGPYHGADWGFAQDPTVGIRCWIAPSPMGNKLKRLMVEYEAWKLHCELDDTGNLFKDNIPRCDQYLWRADSSRPETISHVRQKAQMRIEPAEKWKGSVEDGITFLRNFEKIVIHPRCQRMDEERKAYRYKTDRLTGDVLPEIVDADNHCIDAIRYALQPLIMASTGLGIWMSSSL